MRIGVVQELSIGLAVALCAGGGPGGAAAGGAAGPPPPPHDRPSRAPVVDQAAHDRGRALWATRVRRLPRGAGPRLGHRARTSSARRPSTTTAPRRRPGSVLGPFLKAGHPDAEQEAERVVHRRGDRGPGQLPAPARQRHDARLAGLHGRRHRHRRREGRRGVLQRRRRLRDVPHRLGAQPRGHRDRAFPRPVDLQQRMLFPGGARSGGRGRGGPPPAGRPPAPHRWIATPSPSRSPPGPGHRCPASSSRRAISS